MILIVNIYRIHFETQNHVHFMLSNNFSKYMWFVRLL